MQYVATLMLCLPNFAFVAAIYPFVIAIKPKAKDCLNAAAIS
jgi:hypothetical protein